MKYLILTLIIFLSELNMSQNFDYEKSLYDNYEVFKEKTLTDRRFKHSDILKLIDQVKNSKEFEVNKVGASSEGRDIFLLSIGNGKKKIFLWSQMHGDEPTATAALFDIFNYFQSNLYNDFNKKLLNEVTIYFMPMVNPDGAEIFQRRNVFDIDLNRDAVRLQTPEAAVLKNVFDSLKADYGFNLHDQDHRYSVGYSFKTAAISFLAPAYNYEKDVNPVRENSIKLISRLYKMLSVFIPGHIAKYSDDYEPRAFGDNFQKWGTSTILIESGGWMGDPEKQFIRKLNFISILSSFKEIAESEFLKEDVSTYDKIPFNEKYIFDMILRNLTYEKNGSKIKVDVGINLEEKGLKENRSFYIKSSVADIGDLSVFFAYNDFDFSGYSIQAPKIYSENEFNISNLKDSDLYNLYKNGYTNILTKEIVRERHTNRPINLIYDTEIDNTFLEIGDPANFLLLKEGKIKYVIVNGFLQKVSSETEFRGNGVVIK